MERSPSPCSLGSRQVVPLERSRVVRRVLRTRGPAEAEGDACGDLGPRFRKRLWTSPFLSLLF